MPTKEKKKPSSGVNTKLIVVILYEKFYTIEVRLTSA